MIPEPLSITAAVLGIVSFLVTATNALKSIVGYANNYGNYGADLETFISKFMESTTKIQNWKIFWRADGTLGVSFHEELWGRPGYSTIYQLVSSAEIRSRRVWQELERRMGLLASHDQQTRRQCRKEHRNNHGFWTKLLDSTIRSDVINLQLQAINEDIDRVERLSRLYVGQTHGLSVSASNDDELRGWIREYFSETFVTAIASSSSQHADALYQEFSGIDYRICHMSLEGLLRIPQEDEETISSQTGAHRLIYDLIANNGTRYVLTATLGAVITVPGQLPCSVQMPQQQQQMRLTCTCPSKPRRWFVIRRAGKTPGHNPVTYDFVNHADLDTTNWGAKVPSSNLRALLLDDGNDFVWKLHDDFTRTERTRLAYQLAVFTFILLSTKWTSQLCSCMVSFAPSQRGRKYHISIGQDARHLGPVTAEYNATIRQWCEELSNVPIKRLGLLLTEIAIGATIFDVVVNHTTNVVEVDFEHFWDQQSLPEPSYVRDVKQRVEKMAGTPYAEAVGWCLTQRHEPINAETRDLAMQELYDSVLQPLICEYDRVCQRASILRRQRARRAREVW